MKKINEVLNEAIGNALDEQFLMDEEAQYGTPIFPPVLNALCFEKFGRFWVVLSYMCLASYSGLNYDYDGFFDK